MDELQRRRRKGQRKSSGVGLDGCYDNHEEFVEAVSSFLEQHDSHVFDSSLPSLRIKATLKSTFLIDNDISVETCTQTSDQDVQQHAAVLLRNVMFDCTGYFFHMRRVNAKPDGPITFTMTCSRSSEAKLERDPFRVQRYTIPKEVFDCQGELHFTMSKLYESITMVYEHNCHMETDKFHMTEEWERDAANDFRSAQLLVAEQGGSQLIEGLQEPGVSLAFLTPCFTNQEKYNRAKMTEVFANSTFGTRKHGYELCCVLTEYDLVSLPLSYLLLDTRSLHEGKRGHRLTQWFTALRNAGLTPTTVHNDKDFAEVTAASIAFRTNNSKYNHHLCLWHSLRAIDQYITGKARGRGLDSADTVRTSTRSTVLPSHLHFLTEESQWMLSKGETKKCTADQARILRSMIKRHLLRHPLLPKVVCDKNSAPASLVEMLEYCRSIGQPRLFRYFWANWYRPSFDNVGSRWEIASLCGRQGSSDAIPISRTTMRLESHWRILKRDYASHLIRPRLDVLTYIICPGLVPSRIHLYLQVEAGRVKPSVYVDFVSLWRRCADAIDERVVDERNLYHADKRNWVCSCPSFIFNSSYMCKHLASYYSVPRPDSNGKYTLKSKNATRSW
ncbi:hypothetical protein V1506DRAFT_555031 [Lipomyces tetrasporus]